MNILEAMSDPSLFGDFFRRRWQGGDSWMRWKAFLTALFALTADAGAKQLIREHTDRDDERAEPFHECFVVAGRRSGKSLIASLVAVFLACFENYEGVLAPGEWGTVMLVASDRRQARVILSYIDAFLSLPMLAPLVISRLKESIELKNHIRLEIHTSSFRAVRGYTIIAAICDEIAFYRDADSALPDIELLNALRPGLATTNGLLLGISSPYAKRGALYEAYRENYGKVSDTLIWKAASTEMNPTLSKAVVAAAYLHDRSAARAEYGGEFRDDIESFVGLEVVEARIVSDRHELAPVSGQNYTAFVDPSGGRGDAAAIAIAHSTGNVVVLDLIREITPPFSPQSACEEFAEIAKRYGINEVIGDAFGGDFPREQFQMRGIRYTVSEKNRSELYLQLLPMLMSDQVELLDNRRLATQLVSLERRSGRTGKDCVDHQQNSHDDIANACAGAIISAAMRRSREPMIFTMLIGEDGREIRRPSASRDRWADPNWPGPERIWHRF